MPWFNQKNILKEFSLKKVIFSQLKEIRLLWGGTITFVETNVNITHFFTLTIYSSSAYFQIFRHNS